MSQCADASALHSAFRRLSKALHPDTTDLPADEAAKKFQQLCEAYELLADPLRRETYDAMLAERVSILEAPVNSFLEETINQSSRRLNGVEVRRPLSGGELFSLLLLGISLLISLLLGVGFGLIQGRDLQFRPSWLILNSIQVLGETFHHFLN